ncbi:LAFA_0G11606g1_1 [Lachancea sp. 'fantastica']|nr:LAFA_0G11606g1_1 [Lachancea sp. 'fantastica']
MTSENSGSDGDKFKKVSRTSSKLNATAFDDSLRERRCIIRKSRMFQTLQRQLEPFVGNVRQIRCLAIGSFFEEFAALYQLALLLELTEHFNAESEKPLEVSIYDPVFTKADKEFISKQGPEWSIDEKLEDDTTKTEDVLFFLPHAPLDLTEDILTLEKPKLMLANHVAKHVDRYTKSQLFKKYPKLAKLNHLLGPTESDVLVPSSDFQTFVSRRARRKRKNIPSQDPADYSAVETYFGQISILTDFDGGTILANEPWLNSFSDLALHRIL